MERLNKLIGHMKPVSPSPIVTQNVSNSQFQYTMSDNTILTDEQRKFYEENGFLVIKKLLNPSEIKRFYNRFDELVANPSDGVPQMIIMRDVSLKGLERKDRKDERVVTKLQNWAYDRVLWDYAKHPTICKYMESIIGSDIRAIHFMVINKPSDPGALSSRHPIHQDQWYFPFSPSKYIACSWTALQHVHRGNGCLSVVPGTHKTFPLLPHAYPQQWAGRVNKAYHGIQYQGDINELISKRVHLEMQPGDTVFFHPLLLHASGANLTNNNRRSISTHYANSTLVDFKRGGVIPEQSVIATEVEQMVKRMKGLVVTFDQVWKYKSRQVKGDVGNFKP